MPLKDGTNDEREDLTTPFPSDWTKDSLKDIKLHGMHASPPCAKIRAILDLAGVTYERISGKVKGSDYQKVPVVFVNDRQINDSHIIVKTLAPILFETALSEKDIELEKMLTYGMMISFEKECFGNPIAIKQMLGASGLMTGATGWMLNNMVPFQWLGSKAVAKFTEKHPDLLSPLEYCTKLKSELDERGSTYLSGNDDKPGIMDASAYGVLCVFVGKNDEKDDSTIKFAKEAMTKSGLDDWYNRTQKQIPNVLERQGKWPFYT